MFVQLNKYVYVSLFFVLFLFASPGGSAAHLTVSEIFPSVIKYHIYIVGNEELGNGYIFCNWIRSWWSNFSLLLQ